MLVTALSALCVAAHFVDGGAEASTLLTCLSCRDSEWTGWNSSSGKTALEALLSITALFLKTGLSIS